MKAKYEVGQRVKVVHDMGTWTGTIVYRAQTGTESESFSGWEYEVSNAPQDYDVKYPEYAPHPPSSRWFPLLWEEEIVEVLP